MNGQRFQLGSLLALCLAGAGQRAGAVEVRTFAIEATLIEVDEELAADVLLGDPVSGDFAYDISMTPPFPDDPFTDYIHPVGFEGVRLAIENPRTGEELRYVPKRDSSYQVSVFRDHYLLPGDEDSAVDLWQDATPPVPDVFDLVYIDFSGTGVLSETTLPTEYNLDDWESAAVYLTGVGTAQIHTITPIAAGDFDRDTTVGGGDYIAWKTSFGSEVDLFADGSRDGQVGPADYTIWRDHLGIPNGVASTVPEASSLGLAVAAAAATLIALRRHNPRLLKRQPGQPGYETTGYVSGGHSTSARQTAAFSTTALIVKVLPCFH